MKEANISETGELIMISNDQHDYDSTVKLPAILSNRFRRSL